MISPLPATITDPVILIRLNRSYREGMSAHALYEATRGRWVIGLRREKAKYALAVFDGTVREVYQIVDWHPAGTTTYTTRKFDTPAPGRWEFTGNVASDEVRERYVGRSATEHFTKDSRNPIRYVNV